MGLRYDNLDDETRRLMVDEMQLDAQRGAGVYISGLLTLEGMRRWPELLRQAAESGDDVRLERGLNGCLKAQTPRRTMNGVTMVRAPHNAAERLAEGEFNTYYMRALCLRAIEMGTAVVAYRAKAVSLPRPDAESVVGRAIEPGLLLEALRSGGGSQQGLPAANNGMTVRLDAH